MEITDEINDEVFIKSKAADPYKNGIQFIYNDIITKLLASTANKIYQDFKKFPEISEYANEIYKLYKDSKVKYIVKDTNTLICLVNAFIYLNNAANLNWLDTKNISDLDNFIFHEKFCGDVSEWDVSHIKSFHKLFFGCMDFNGDLSKWDMSNAEDLSNMFDGCITFNKPLNDWDVSNVINMREMFADCYNFQQPLDKWNVSKCDNFEAIFYNTQYGQDLSSWRIKNDKNLYLYWECEPKKQPKRIGTGLSAFAEKMLNEICLLPPMTIESPFLTFEIKQ